MAAHKCGIAAECPTLPIHLLPLIFSYWSKSGIKSTLTGGGLVGDGGEGGGGGAGVDGGNGMRGVFL